MSRVYGVALIGCGHMGEAHIQDIYYKENVRMEYVCDLNQEQAKNFQRRYGAAHICTDYRECAASPAVDIVIIATYAGSHLTILTVSYTHLDVYKRQIQGDGKYKGVLTCPEKTRSHNRR